MTPRSTQPKVAMLLCVAGVGLAQSAVAHVGPPFPILEARRIPGYSVSLWADPDIGEALFYVMAEPDKGVEKRAVIHQVRLWVEPVSRRLPREEMVAEQQSARGYLRFVATPLLDAAEMWKVGVDIRLADGGTHGFETEVEATPPGLGPWDMVIYLFPFVLFGGLWAMVFIRRTRRPPTGRGARRTRGENAGIDVGATAKARREDEISSSS
jgi:hypothetical protein